MTTQFILDSRLQENSFEIIELKLCKVLLKNNSLFPWLVLIPKIANMRELIDLSAEDQQQLMTEIALCSSAVKTTFSLYKINVAAFGNIVEQLHIHVIGRFKNDLAWPEPVFGKGEKKYEISAAHDTISKLQGFLLKHHNVCRLDAKTT